MDRAFKALDEIHSTEIAFPSRSLQGDCSPSGIYSSSVAKFSKHFVHMYSTLFILNDRGITAVLPWYCLCCTAVVSACFVETFTCVCDVILVDCPFVAGALLHGNSVVAVSTYWALPLKFRWWCFHRVFSVFFRVWPVPSRATTTLVSQPPHSTESPMQSTMANSLSWWPLHSNE